MGLEAITKNIWKFISVGVNAFEIRICPKDWRKKHRCSTYDKAEIDVLRAPAGSDWSSCGRHYHSWMIFCSKIEDVKLWRYPTTITWKNISTFHGWTLFSHILTSIKSAKWSSLFSESAKWITLLWEPTFHTWIPPWSLLLFPLDSKIVFFYSRHQLQLVNRQNLDRSSILICSWPCRKRVHHSISDEIVAFRMMLKLFFI